ncbi:autophagy protein 16, interacts with Atg12p-Atg5p [Friedmanniomyces endolithicus]|nr:autophagy protein 16, interacts with Atg12p-Atg5p [Friedmanniomyces endolithicus]
MSDWIEQYSAALTERDAREQAHKVYIDAYPDPTPNDLLSSLRTDLSTTQKARRTLANQVADLTLALSTLQSTSATSTTQLALLTRQKADTERKLRDRDEELRGKNRMVVLAQDEMVAQGLQLSLAEQKAEGLERENRELVARWMERMGKEAERVNRDSKWE